MPPSSAGGGPPSLQGGMFLGGRHVATLDTATRGDRQASARYRTIMAPLGLGDELRAALITPSGCWGYLCLHRADSPYGFSSADVRLIERLTASLANGCRLSLASRGAEEMAAAAPGVVVLHSDLTLAAITGEAERLLADIADYSSSSPRLPAAIYAAAASLLSIDGTTALVCVHSQRSSEVDLRQDWRTKPP